MGKGSECYTEVPMTSFFMVAKIDYDACLFFLKLIAYIDRQKSKLLYSTDDVNNPVLCVMIFYGKWYDFSFSSVNQ